jgi:hypothetical protein
VGDTSEFEPLSIKLRYSGELAENHQIDLYDFAQALVGLERSLALTTHLVLNDEVITQATALRGARVICEAPKPGSLTILAGIGMAGAGLYKLGTLRKDNPLGHLVYSAYDFLVHKVTGQDLDYDKSLRKLFEESHQNEKLGLRLPRESKFDSLAEKIEPPLTRLHRPIVNSGTAEKAEIIFPGKSKKSKRSVVLNHDSFARMKYRARGDDISVIRAKIAVFNPNTFNGRLFVPELDRTIPFFLTHAARSPAAFLLIGRSYSRNLNDRGDDAAELKFDVLTTRSKLGRVVKFSVIRVGGIEDDDDFDVIEID